MTSRVKVEGVLKDLLEKVSIRVGYFARFSLHLCNHLQGYSKNFIEPYNLPARKSKKYLILNEWRDDYYLYNIVVNFLH